VAEAFAIREAWLYRDWQAAIGDLMLIESSTHDPRFSVIGYRTFEAMYRNQGENKLLLERLARVTEDLDVRGDPRLDARIDQLRSVHVTVARLILEFHSSGRNRRWWHRPIDWIHERRNPNVTIGHVRATINTQGPLADAKRPRHLATTSASSGSN
jgi:hypothetical protein